jgi:hypothetical protein
MIHIESGHIITRQLTVARLNRELYNLQPLCLSTFYSYHIPQAKILKNFVLLKSLFHYH